MRFNELQLREGKAMPVAALSASSSSSRSASRFSVDLGSVALGASASSHRSRIETPSCSQGMLSAFTGDIFRLLAVIFHRITHMFLESSGGLGGGEQ